VDEEQRRRSREAFVKITLNFLKKMKQEELAERLQSSKRIRLFYSNLSRMIYMYCTNQNQLYCKVCSNE
ncbi:hypothetical protein AMECASPLE_038977, partial [Ameca splendens]